MRVVIDAVELLYLVLSEVEDRTFEAPWIHIGDLEPSRTHLNRVYSILRTGPFHDSLIEFHPF